MRRGRLAGFTLIELLVAIAIIGIVTAIAIMNYFNAVERARQKRTMADIRSIAQAWEARVSEKGNYAAAGFTFPVAMAYDDVTKALVPTYMRAIPRYDGWGRPLDFGGDPRVYAIRSAGRDGKWEGNTYVMGIAENPDCDLVFSNGNFVRYADVKQSE